MNFDSPFFVTQVECPVCGKMNDFENIKAGAYSETKRDTDFCPKGIIWVNPEYQKANPLLYFMATCPHCFYTHEFNNSFKEWKKSRFFSTHGLSSIRKEHLQELGQPESVINRLGEALDPEGHPFESAVIKLLLGIHDETIIEEFNPWDVGRHYLRIAWLYRENAQEKETARNLSEFSLTRLERTMNRLRSHYRSEEDQIHHLAMAVETCFRPPAGIAEQDRQRRGLRTEITEALNKIKEDISSLQENLDELAKILAESNNLMVASESGNIEIAAEAGENSIGGETLQARENQPIFATFLASIKEIWPEIPLSELEAMKFALGYYKRSYREITDIKQENQRIQAAYLIAELSLRVGNYGEAESHFDEATRIGQDFIRRNQDDLNKIALAQKIVELAERQKKLNLVKVKPQV